MAGPTLKIWKILIVKEIVKLSIILIGVCMGVFLSCSRPYQTMGGYKIYKLKSAPDFADRGPIDISALVTRDTVEYGRNIEIKVIFFNVSADTIKILPRAKIYLQQKGFETYTEPIYLDLNVSTDIREIRTLSPGDSAFLKFETSDYQDFFVRPQIYTVEVVYRNSIYQIDSVKVVAGSLRSNPVDVRFK